MNNNRASPVWLAEQHLHRLADTIMQTPERKETLRVMIQAGRWREVLIVVFCEVASWYQADDPPPPLEILIPGSVGSVWVPCQMACLLKCLGLEEIKEPENKPVFIVDVEEVLAKAAWEAFIVDKSWWKKRTIKKKDYVIEVPMNYYHFEQIAQDFQIRKSNPLRPTEQGSSSGPNNGQRRAQGTAGPSLIGLKTTFNNNTEKEQKYNFIFEKTRHTLFTITYQKGYSIGGRANFTLGLPKLAEDGSLGAEVEAHINVTKATGETFEETVKTSATSEITVGAGKHYTATVVTEERTLLADFKISIMMTMPAKEAPVYVKDRRTGEVVLVSIVDSLPFYFKKFQGVEVPLDEVTGEPRKDAVIFHIEGIVDGVQVSGHRINLQQDSATAEGGQEAVLQSVQNSFIMDKLQDPVTSRVP